MLSVWCPTGSSSEGDADPLQKGIPRLGGSGIILLGSAVGSEKYVKNAVEERIKKVCEVTYKLPSLEFVLLSSCLSLPKVMYTLRMVDPSNLPHLWHKFDCILREVLCRILGSPLTDLQWQQANLLVSMGGLGIRAATDHAPAAYSTSFLSSQPLIRSLLYMTEEISAPLPSSVLQLLTSNQGEQATPDSLEGLTQKTVSLTIDLHKKKRLPQKLEQEGRQREVA